MFHCSFVDSITVTSHERHMRSFMSDATRLFVHLFVQYNFKENTKAQHYWPFVGKAHHMIFKMATNVSPNLAALRGLIASILLSFSWGSLPGKPDPLRAHVQPIYSPQLWGIGKPRAASQDRYVTPSRIHSSTLIEAGIKWMPFRRRHFQVHFF